MPPPGFTWVDKPHLAALAQPLPHELVGDVVQYGDSNRLCYVRGPDGIMIALAQELP